LVAASPLLFQFEAQAGQLFVCLADLLLEHFNFRQAALQLTASATCSECSDVGGGRMGKAKHSCASKGTLHLYHRNIHSPKQT